MNIKFEIYQNGWIDISNMVDNGQNWTMTLDSSMDYGTFTMSALDSAINYPIDTRKRLPSNTPLRLTLTGESGSIVQHFVANDTVRHSGRLANHSVRIKEPTTLLENYFINGLASSDNIVDGVSIPKTQWETLTRIVYITPARKNGTARKFFINPNLESRLSALTAPNYRFNYRQTLRDVLFNIAWDFEAIPRLEWNEETKTFNIITFDFYNEKRTGQVDYYTGDGLIDDAEYDLDETEYCQGLYNPVSNMITQSGIGSLTYVPSKNGYITPICDTVQYEDKTAYIPTYKRIYKVESLKCGVVVKIPAGLDIALPNGGTVFVPDIDLSNFIIDKREWDMKSAKSVTTYDATAQACWLYYTIGSDKVENLFVPNMYCDVIPWGNPIYLIVKKALADLGNVQVNGYVVNPDTMELENDTPHALETESIMAFLEDSNGNGYYFQVGGLFFIDAPCTSYKPNFAGESGDTGLLIPYNQSDDLLSSLSLGNNQYNQVKKTGNEVVTNSYKISDVTQIPTCGHLFGDGTRVAKLEFTYSSNDLVQITVTRCLNEIARSNQVRLDRKYRNWNIPDEQVTRYVNYNDFCKLSLKADADFTPNYQGFSNVSFNTIYRLRAQVDLKAPDTARFCLADTTTAEKNVLLPLNKMRFGKAICLDFAMQTPTVAGTSNPKYETDGTRYVQDKTQNSTALLLRLGYSVITEYNNQSLIANPWSPSIAQAYPIPSRIPEYLSVYSADVVLYKDVAETIAWHHQINFVADRLIIGDAFVDYQQLLDANDIGTFSLLCEVYDRRKPNLEVYDNTGCIGTAPVAYSQYYNVVQIPTQEMADLCRSWAIYLVIDGKKQLLIGTNNALTGVKNQYIQITL